MGHPLATACGPQKYTMTFSIAGWMKGATMGWINFMYNMNSIGGRQHVMQTMITSVDLDFSFKRVGVDINEIATLL